MINYETIKAEIYNIFVEHRHRSDEVILEMAEAHLTENYSEYLDSERIKSYAVRCIDSILMDIHVYKIVI